MSAVCVTAAGVGIRFESGEEKVLSRRPRNLNTFNRCASTALVTTSSSQEPDPVTGAVVVPISLATTFAQPSPGEAPGKGIDNSYHKGFEVRARQQSWLASPLLITKRAMGRCILGETRTSGSSHSNGNGSIRRCAFFHMTRRRGFLCITFADSKPSWRF